MKWIATEGVRGRKADDRLRLALPTVLLLLAASVTACNPTVKVEAPDKPIVINLNVKIEQEVRVKIDKDVDNLIKSDPNLF
ncbi:MAG TPA: YnbE family lipoprotein [Terriglobia bacterium]|nr:YnbE family lipoprotein [Terriglobia bacterium]